MNRRTFIERLTMGAAAFTILPGAGRVWRAEREVLVARLGVIPANMSHFEMWCDSTMRPPGINLWCWKGENGQTVHVASETMLRPTDSCWTFRATPRELREMLSEAKRRAVDLAALRGCEDPRASALTLGPV